MKAILVLCFALVLGWGVAGSAAQCVSDSNIYGQAQVQRDGFNDGTCFVSIITMLDTHLKYRSYLVSDDGLIMVFNSFGNGPEEVAAGARNFYFFPRTKSLDLSYNQKKNELNVRHSNGDVITFSAETAEISAVGRGKVELANQIEPSNRGGVEFPKYKGLMMDVGFAVGHSPSSEKNGKSVFRDSKGRTCEVDNTEVFTYYGSGDVKFKFNDSDLSSFLRFRCPMLKVDF